LDATAVVPILLPVTEPSVILFVFIRVAVTIYFYSFRLVCFYLFYPKANNELDTNTAYVLAAVFNTVYP
jgi:hypothetical protein